MFDWKWVNLNMKKKAVHTWHPVVQPEELVFSTKNLAHKALRFALACRQAALSFTLEGPDSTKARRPING